MIKFETAQNIEINDDFNLLILNDFKKKKTRMFTK